MFTTHYKDPMGDLFYTSHYKEITGDLLALADAGHFDLIVQGCNCHCTMGSGIARSIREKYPDAYAADLVTTAGDYRKLGNYSVGYNDFQQKKFLIINAYTQYDFNRGPDRVDLFEYAAFQLILQKLVHQFPGMRFGFPLIGCGLADGDEEKMLGMLFDFACEVNQTGGSVTLVRFE